MAQLPSASSLRSRCPILLTFAGGRGPGDALQASKLEAEVEREPVVTLTKVNIRYALDPSQPVIQGRAMQVQTRGRLLDVACEIKVPLKRRKQIAVRESSSRFAGRRAARRVPERRSGSSSASGRCRGRPNTQPRRSSTVAATSAARSASS